MIYTPCVRCGYCCKKSTCPLGIQFDSQPENCSYLGGNKIGEYFCRFVTENIVHDAKTMIAVGAGCCSPLNTDRKIALKNRTPSLISPATEVVDVLEDVL